MPYGVAHHMVKGPLRPLQYLRTATALLWRGLGTSFPPLCFSTWPAPPCHQASAGMQPPPESLPSPPAHWFGCPHSTPPLPGASLSCSQVTLSAVVVCPFTLLLCWVLGWTVGMILLPEPSMVRSAEHSWCLINTGKGWVQGEPQQGCVLLTDEG